MLERYFVKPSTVDRIRASWIAPAVEQYVAWIMEHGYSAGVVHSRVPVLVAFGEFARDRGAKSLADLPVHIDDFIAHRVAERASLRADGRTGPTLAKDLRGPIEQMLGVAVPGFHPTGRRSIRSRSPRLFPAFSPTWSDERGLRPASVGQYRHHLDRFEAYLDRIGVRGLDELSPAVLSGYVVERASAGLAKLDRSGRVRGAASVPALRAPRGLLDRDLSRRVGWPQVYRLASIPVRSRGRTWTRCWRASIGALRRQAGLRDLAAAGDLRPARSRGRGA